MKQRLFIILIPLLPLIVSAQYKLRAVEIATGDSIWQNVAQDSMFKKVAGNYVFAFKPRYKNYSPSFNGGTANQYIKKNSTLDYDYSWSTIAGGGDLLAANNLSDVANVATARQNIGLNTTANISPSANKNFITDAQQIVIGSILGINTGDNATNTQYSGLAASKQDALVSGTNIKTVNGNNVLGSGDISISSAVAWGGITGLLTNQSDLVTALALKANLISPTFVTPVLGAATATTINGGTITGNNSGDNATNTQYSSLVSNATHSGDATGATVLTLATVNSNVGSFGSATQVPNYTVNGKGLITAASNTTIQIAESQVTNLVSDLSAKAPLASPAFTGTATGIGIPVYAQVTGSNATTTGQALVDVTGLSVALTTNAVYEFEAIMSVSTTAVTTGTAYGCNFSAAGAAVEAQISGAATSTATKTLRINAFNTATALYLATSAQTGGIIIKGRVTTGVNPGNFTISHLKLTSGTSTIFIGSLLKITRIS